MLTLRQFVKAWNSYFHHEMDKLFFVRDNWNGGDFLIHSVGNVIYINFVMINENIIGIDEPEEKGELVWKWLAELFSSDVMISIEKFSTTGTVVFTSNQGGIGYEYINAYKLHYNTIKNEFHIIKNNH